MVERLVFHAEGLGRIDLTGGFAFQELLDYSEERSCHRVRRTGRWRSRRL